MPAGHAFAQRNSLVALVAADLAITISFILRPVDHFQSVLFVSNTTGW